MLNEDFKIYELRNEYPIQYRKDIKIMLELIYSGQIKWKIITHLEKHSRFYILDKSIVNIVNNFD